MDRQVALYWDFENIHASICSIEHGSEWYRKHRFGKQPSVVNIDAIMHYVAGVGDVDINKAYAHWGNLYAYSSELQNHAMDLIQLFPRGGHAKNGADIRLSIEVIEDLTLYPHISTVVIVGGDSDYIAVAQKVRQKGRSIIGIGAKETTNQYWIKSCNEFKYYSSLLVKSASVADIEAEGYEGSDLDEARGLLRRAIVRIAEETGEPYARKAAIKPMMVRLESSFDESNYNFGSFTDFLEAFSDEISIVKGEHDHHIMLSEDAKHENTGSDQQLHPYEHLLKKQQVRLVPPELMMAGIAEAFRVFSQHGSVETYSLFKQRLSDSLRQRNIEFEESDLSKIKGLLYKARCFETDRDNLVVRLASSLDSAEKLFESVMNSLVKRVASNVEEVDSKSLARLLLGNEEQSPLIDRAIEEYRSSQKPTLMDA